MKKWLISFLLLISSFFVSLNFCNALVVFDYDSINLTNDLENINTLISHIDSVNVNNIPYTITFQKNDSLNKIGYDVNFFNSDDLSYHISSLSNSDVDRFQQYLYGTSDSSFVLSNNGNYSNKIFSTYYAYNSYCTASSVYYLPLNATSSQLNSFLSNIDCVINGLNSSNIPFNIQSLIFNKNPSLSDNLFNDTTYLGGITLYSSFDLDLVLPSGSYSYNPVRIIYNSNNYDLDLGDVFVPYFNALNGGLNTTVVNLVKDLGNNTFGFYQNVVGINATSLSGPLDTLSIICEENKPFINGYCSMNYDDLKNHNSDVSVFNNYATEFTQLFGSNTGYLYNDKYYLYSFRIQKPFVPEVGNVFINSLTNDSAQVNILNVYANDGGSYTDYVVKFKIENTDYNANTNLKDILVVFRDGLGTYYNDSIPSTFNYSVYRSFKLQYFDTEPTINDVNDFYNNNDLSYIDGVSSQTSFFTDNEFNTFGFGGIITAPFRFLYALENYESCSDITVPFPHSNQNLTLTCVRESIPTSLNPLIVILQVILSGIISYRIAVGTLKIIKDVSSPDNANIEVVDL